MFDQRYSYFNRVPSKRQCEFRQGHSIQHSLLLMVEKFKKNLDNSGVGGMVVTDLSKAFDCLRQDLLISKLAAYGLTNHQTSVLLPRRQNTVD